MLNLSSLFDHQLAQWPACRERYEQLAQAQHRTLTVDGRQYQLTYNPARERSARAVVVDGQVQPTADSTAVRPCFLCEDALPPEQLRVEVETLPSHHHYLVALNPYPIVDHHFTLIGREHERQDITGRLWDMAYFADLFPDYLIFFNGACAGASAPDHAHFQAVPKRCVPMLSWTEDQRQQLGVSRQMPHVNGSDHLNIITWTEGSEAYWLVIERRVHRPRQYFLPEDDPQKVLISPASLEFCGLIPLCRESDYQRMTAHVLADILDQCQRSEPLLHVGIVEGQELRFSADERVHAMHYVGEDQIKDVIDYDSNRAESVMLSEYWNHADPFTLEGVTIGKEFHWQQQEDQVFRGSLHIIAREGQLHAINLIRVEEYLKSVISSEMSATNSLELLKAHAIISRSWVLRQMHHDDDASSCQVAVQSSAITAGHLDNVYWDHTDHHLFDVCADDHCQRYQGITRQASALVAQAVEQTRGMVLTDADGQLCDARFSKCCGGITERFSTCWQDVDYGYLLAIADPYCSPDFIEALPGGRAAVLAQVLNTYDQQTAADYHDWTVRYTQSELSALVSSKTGQEVGMVELLEVVERGASGRIKRLRIVGTKQSIVIGKELMIRRALSATHLYSSWFEVEMQPAAAGAEPVFVLHGHGWGHGVGLCQIGAAAMAVHGFTAQQILAHYYPGAEITTRY